MNSDTDYNFLRDRELSDVGCPIISQGYNEMRDEEVIDDIFTDLRNIIYKSGMISADRVINYNSGEEEEVNAVPTMKAGKFLRKWFNIDDSEKLKYICDCLHCISKEEEYFFRLLTIDTAYSAIVSKGDFRGNCMQGDDCMGLLINEEIDVLGLFKVVDGEREMIGRALMWKDVEVSDYNNSDNFGTVNFLDRIYVEEPFMRRIFFKWAMSNGWFRKRYQNYRDLTEVVNPYGENVQLRMSYPMGMPSDRIFPFLDTFRYMDEEGVRNAIGYSLCIALDSSSGNYNCMESLGTTVMEDGDIVSSDDIVYCETTEQHEDIDSCISIEDDSGDCYWYLESDDNIHYLDGQYYHEENDDIVYSSYENEWILAVESFEDVHGDVYHLDCEDLVEVGGEMYLTTDDLIIYSSSEGEYLLKDDAVCIEKDGFQDEWFPAYSDEIAYCDDEDRWIRRDEAVFINGECYHNDCSDIMYDEESNCYKLNCYTA